MQALRTAAQKELSVTLSPMATTLTRYLYGLPFVLVYLAGLICVNPDQSWCLSSLVFSNSRFLAFASVGAIAQVVATAFMIKVFSRKNFAIATGFAKTEAIQVALFASIFFYDLLSPMGWLSVVVGVVGVLLISGLTWLKKQSFSWLTVFYGLMSGALFASTSLCLREASLSLNIALLSSAAITLVYMVALQTFICTAYITILEKGQWKRLIADKPRGLFVGFSSALGSIGWFTAMTLQNAAIVKTLGQTEILLTMGITHFYFRENIKLRELCGVFCIVASIVLVVNR